MYLVTLFNLETNAVLTQNVYTREVIETSDLWEQAKKLKVDKSIVELGDAMDDFKNKLIITRLA